jgi:hypothetical protein
MITRLHPILLTPSSGTVQIIPVVEEDYDLTKKTVIHETTIVKRMVTKTEKLRSTNNI